LSEILLKVENLTKHFPIAGKIFSGKRWVYAVDGASFGIPRGETLSLVGESGSGKTTVGKTILRLIEPTAGNVWLNGCNIMTLNEKELRGVRKDMQIIFQDPFSSLNPRMTVIQIISEALTIHHLAQKNKKDQVVQILETVGMGAESLYRYPHEFSGGQRQRIGIARALAVSPQLIVADEPISSLDVSIQAQIINLFEDLQEKLGLTYLFISHDLNVVAHISDYVAVMYLGKIAELAPARMLYQDPRHPYTLALLSSVPVPDPSRKRQEIILQGEVPSPIDPPQGCRFHPRCDRRNADCSKTEPPFQEITPSHYVACFLC
jgi:oligopeptide transport system ATP-binding protein